MTSDSLPAAVGQCPAAYEAEALSAVRLWPESAGANARSAAVTTTLSRESARVDRVAQAMLATALLDATRRLAATFVLPAQGDHAAGGQGPTIRDDMLALDAALADWMDAIESGRATNLRTLSAQRLQAYRGGDGTDSDLYKLWGDCAHPALAAVARTLWEAHVEAQWLHRHAVAPAGLPRVVAYDVLVPAGSGRLTISPTDGAVRGDGPNILGTVATLDPAILTAVHGGLAQFGTVAWHRLLRLLVSTGHSQRERHAAGEPGVDFRVVEFLGGLSALALAVRHTSRDFGALEAMLTAGQHITWMQPTLKIGGLWTWLRVTKPAPGQVSVVRITLGEALLPGMAAQMANLAGGTHADRMARRLVPELRFEPPVSALRSNDWGKAWMLHRLLLVELVDRAEELFRFGSVCISEDRLRELARSAGLPVAALPKLLELWREGESEEAPALLLEPEPGQFTLADPHGLERDFIAASGRLRIEGRANGRKGNRRKHRSLM